MPSEESSAESTGESGLRRRTRTAIVAAAVATWARDWNATLGDVAAAAAVSRSTLHRYFPDRQALVDAAYERAVGAFGTTEGADLFRDQPPIQALEAVMRDAVEAGDAVILLYADPQRFAGRADWEQESDYNSAFLDLIRRAQVDGDLVADVEPEWIVGVMYSLIYAAAEAVNSGHLSRRRAGDVAVRTLFGGIQTERSS